MALTALDDMGFNLIAIAINKSLKDGDQEPKKS
jgi:hypothetical protein